MVTLLYIEQEKFSLHNKQKNQQKRREVEVGGPGLYSSNESCKHVLYKSSVTKHAVNRYRQANVLIIVMGK